MTLSVESSGEVDALGTIDHRQTEETVQVLTMADIERIEETAKPGQSDKKQLT